MQHVTCHFRARTRAQTHGKSRGHTGRTHTPENVNEQLHNPGVFVYVSTMFLRFWYVCSHTVFGIREGGGAVWGVQDGTI